MTLIVKGHVRPSSSGPIVSQNDIGETPLITAVDHGHHKVVEILLNHGANVNLRNKVRPLMAISH